MAYQAIALPTELHDYGARGETRTLTRRLDSKSSKSTNSITLAFLVGGSGVEPLSFLKSRIYSPLQSPTMLTHPLILDDWGRLELPLDGPKPSVLPLDDQSKFL